LKSIICVVSQVAAGQQVSKSSMSAVAWQIFSAQGVKGFFVGAPIRVGMKAPNLGVSLLVVELLTRVAHPG